MYNCCLDPPTRMRILVANIGSTSFKYRLYDMPAGLVTARGLVERIGRPGGCPDYESAIDQCTGDVCRGRACSTPTAVDAVAFKAVHAGPLTGARLVDAEVLGAMEDFTFLAPAHNPPYIAAMRAFQK